MIRFALIVASTLGFFLTAAMGNLMVPLLRSLQNRNRPAQTQQAPEPDRPENADPELERPAQPAGRQSGSSSHIRAGKLLLAGSIPSASRRAMASAPMDLLSSAEATLKLA